MADPVSAEPKNYEEDILLKITMPGRNLRDETVQRAVEAQKKIEEREKLKQQAMQNSTPITNSFGKPITQNLQPRPSQQPVTTQTPRQVYQQPIVQQQITQTQSQNIIQHDQNI